MRTTQLLRRTVGATVLSATLLAALAGAQPAGAGANQQPVDHPPAVTSVGSTTATVLTGATRAAMNAKAEKLVAPKVATGQKAIDELGLDLQEHASEAKLSEKQLEDVLLKDPSVQVSKQSTLQVADPLGGTGATITTGSTNTLIWPVASTLALHSRPSSPLKIYLDFNGHTTTGTVWNSQYGVPTINQGVWGRDTNSAEFSATEAATIQQAFASVTEDFAPFNVDVTTQDPGVEGLRRTSSADTSYGIRVVVGRNWMGVANSGYAQIGSFDWNSDTPAYCFADAGTPTKQIVECISHEVGHTVGLYHDGTTAGVTYYGGHGNWAPIMGNSYSKSVTQWSSGQYAGANQLQNDLSVIGTYLGWVGDDYVGTTATTATLPAGTTRSGSIAYGTGEYDAFKFSLTGNRTINLQSWEWVQATDNNLNMRIQITNSAGQVIVTSNPAGTTRTNFNWTLPAGTYYVFLDGVGENTVNTGYSNYDSMGFYNILLQFV